MRAATRKGRTIELDGLGKLDLPAKPTSPALIAAFEGWNDAGEAASGVINHLGIAWQATPIGAVDPEEFYDFQVTRPVLEVADGRTDRLVWPTTRLSLAQPEGLGRDLILVHGIEPNMRWRAFCDELVGAFTELGVELVILLGALLADSPHTRPVQVTAAATDTALAAQLHVEPVDYKGPTGIVGVLQHACADADISRVIVFEFRGRVMNGSPRPVVQLFSTSRNSVGGSSCTTQPRPGRLGRTRTCTQPSCIENAEIGASYQLTS